MKFSCLPALTTLLLILWSVCAHSQWVRQYPIEKLEDVLDMDVSPDGYGFAVGDNDLIFRLDAGTKTWELLPGFGENWRIESVDYLDGSGGNIAVAGGLNVIMTTDGGENWVEFDDALNNVHTLKMFSQTHIIAVSDAGAYVLRNNQWVNLQVNPAAAIKGAFILDSLHIWAYTFAIDPAIYYTTDGGKNWNTNLEINDIDVVRFYDPLYGIATDGRDVYHSTNGGMNWILTGDNAIANSVNDLAFGSSASVLMGATLNGEPALSIDSGKTWMELDPGFVNQRSFSVVALSDDEFWVGNDLSSIIHTENRGTNWMETSGPDRNIIQDIYFLSRSEGFATGQKGMLLRTNDGGTHWEDISFGARSHFSIHGLTLNDLWIGTNQRILHSIDTGNTWTEALVIVGGNINEVLALSSQRIVAGSTSGIIYLSTDGGMNWDTVYNSGAQIRSIAKIDDQRLMATGYNGVILRSEDQGATWAPLAVPEAGLQYEQAIFLDTTGWLVTSSFKKTMWSTMDAGDSWTPINLPVDRFWDGVYFITQDTGIVVGRSNNEGRAYITFSGGQTWTAGYVTSFPLFGVAGVPNPNGTAWIYGYGSDIEVLPYCNTFPAIADFMGNLIPCEDDTVTYSISAENVDNFSWLFPGGWQILGNANNDTVVVAVGSSPGFISVSASNACGETGQLTFNVNPILAPVLFSITGDPFPCAGDIVAYTVFENNVTDFSWFFPADWVVQGNENQSTVMVQVGLMQGVISVSGSNSCGSSMTPDYFVTPEHPPVVSLVSGDLTPCPGDTVTYDFNLGPSDSYQITNVQGLGDWTFLNSVLQAIAGHESGSFVIAITSFCGTSEPYTVVISTEDVPEVEIFFNEATSEFTVSHFGDQYQWYFNGAPIAGANSAAYTAGQNGTYFVEITFANGCTASSDPFNVTTVATIHLQTTSLGIYPVPAKDEIFIEGISGNFNYSVIDLTGRIVDEGNKIDPVILIEHLQKGYYLLNIRHRNALFIGRFIKE